MDVSQKVSTPRATHLKGFFSYFFASDQKRTISPIVVSIGIIFSFSVMARPLRSRLPPRKAQKKAER